MIRPNQHPEVLAQTLSFSLFCFKKAKGVYWGCLHPYAPHSTSPPGGCRSDLSAFIQVGDKGHFSGKFHKGRSSWMRLKMSLTLYNMLNFIKYREYCDLQSNFKA